MSEPTQSIDQIIADLKTMEYQIKCLRRDRTELLGALVDLYESCPCDPDTTDKFLEANHKAVASIEKHNQ